VCIHRMIVPQTGRLAILSASNARAATQPIQALGDNLHRLATGGAPAWGIIVAELIHLATNLLIAALILLITLWASKWAAQGASRAMGRVHRHNGPDVTLQNFIGSLVRYTVLIVGLIAVLGQLGVQTTSVLAALGAASLAIGLALQGGLSNVAAGVMILLLRPYRVGDNVEINGRVGRVKALDLFATRVTDADGRFVYIPNAKAFGDVIVNYTMNETIRIVLDFGIDYDDDVDLALSLLLRCATEDQRIVATPAPVAKLTALNDSTVTVTLRAWTSSQTWFDTKFDIIKSVKKTFEEAGLSFPYPHQVAVESRPWTPPRTKPETTGTPVAGGPHAPAQPSPSRALHPG
jgi:small conductance mechanosensitive channel